MPIEMDRSFLEAALIGLESKRARIEEQVASLRASLGKRRPGRPATTSIEAAKQQSNRRPMSAAGRKRIAAAQKKRWAEARKARAAEEKKDAKRPKAMAAKAEQALA